MIRTSNVWIGVLCVMLVVTPVAEAQQVVRVDLAYRTRGAGYVGVKLDGDLQKALATRFNVVGYPTMIVLGPDGKELGRAVGYQSSKQILTLLGTSRQPDR